MRGKLKNTAARFSHKKFNNNTKQIQLSQRLCEDPFIVFYEICQISQKKVGFREIDGDTLEIS